MEGGKNWEERELRVLVQQKSLPVLTQRAQSTPSPAQCDRHAGDELGPILLDLPDLETLPNLHPSSLFPSQALKSSLSCPWSGCRRGRPWSWRQYSWSGASGTSGIGRGQATNQPVQGFENGAQWGLLNPRPMSATDFCTNQSCESQLAAFNLTGWRNVPTYIFGR